MDKNKKPHGKAVESTLLAGYKHIHVLNGYTLPSGKSRLFKYMPLDRFIQSVDNNELVFVSPEKWYDPFEQLYYGIDCSNKKYNTQDIVCMCVSDKSSTNEDASWRVYSEENKKSVRLSFRTETLLEILNAFAEKEGYEVYVGRAEYSFNRDEIRNLHKTSSDDYAYYFPDEMRVEHYLSLMLLKRPAFEYENEVRFFLVKDKIGAQLLKISCEYKTKKLVTSVMLSPYPPVREGDDIAFKVRNKMNAMESKQLKKVLYEKVGGIIRQSLLYKVCERVKKAD